jgi:hypothetical protein
VRTALPWSEKKIDAGRARERAEKETYYQRGAARKQTNAEGQEHPPTKPTRLKRDRKVDPNSQ